LKARNLLFIFLFFVSTLTVGAKDFSIASYNVENLFDLKLSGSEYKEYHPNTLTWNRLALEKKVSNIAKVLLAMDADIVALQEVESKEALNFLLDKLPSYKYHNFVKKKTTSVGVALVSRYPIIDLETIDVDTFDKYSRDILKATIKVDGKNFVIYNSHWRSKRASESKRIVYAMALLKDIKKLPKDQDYLILGDLNSNYNEYRTFKYEQRLNDTKGITGINQVLNTTIGENFVQKYNINEFESLVHYNTWLELHGNDRFSAKFRGEKITPDNMLLSKQLFDNQGIWYKDKSFQVFKPHYLYSNGRINRWELYKKEGFSDHLPIMATFSTSKQIYNVKDEKYLATIDTLYNIEQVHNFPLKSVVVIYRHDNIAIIKHKDQTISKRAMMIFHPKELFKLGNVYNLKVDQIDSFHGLKEIKKTSQERKLETIEDVAKYHLDAQEIDLFDTQYVNNIVTNLTGIYKKGYLYYMKNKEYKKIRLYFKNGITRPKDGTTLKIKTGHLSTYKSKVQIAIYTLEDFY
jgi:endonuclease/exonuclease/phosphatase family metal-dependent hydrolase